MTKEEKQHLSNVAALGCIACRIAGYGATPAEIHHIREGVGLSQRNSHFNVIPLCPDHHRLGRDAVHVSKAKFTRRFGDELDLLRRTQEEARELNQTFVGRAV